MQIAATSPASFGQCVRLSWLTSRRTPTPTTIPRLKPYLKEPHMNRHQFIATTSTLSVTGFTAPLLTAAWPKTGELPQRPITLHDEFRVTGPENRALQAAAGKQGRTLRA